MENKLTDNEIIKALECCIDNDRLKSCKELDCPLAKHCRKDMDALEKACLDLINRKDKRIAELQVDNERLKHILVNFMAEIEDWEYKYNIDTSNIPKIAILGMEKEANIKAIISNAIKELAEKITEIFMRYAHLHSYADQARQDYIETVDGYEIEMQSVWDVFSLKKYEMAEYEEMSRLQKNIETIEKERLLTELEKDFRLLVKEMVGE